MPKAADDPVIVYQFQKHPTGQDPLGTVGDTNVMRRVGLQRIREFQIGSLFGEPCRDLSGRTDRHG